MTEEILCEKCSRKLTAAVIKYCEAHARSFDDKMLCTGCQKIYKAERSRLMREIKTYGDLLKEGKKETKSLPQIVNIVENDLLEVFGNTGGGKSRLLTSWALEVLNNGEKAMFIDTERNIFKRDRESLGDNYYYTPQLSGLHKAVLELPTDLNFVFIDSLGMPVLTQFSKFNMKERGEALLKLTAILGDLKEWTYKSGATAVFSNQPVSEMSSSGGDLRPFGDKSQFVVKEIWKLYPEAKGNITVSTLKTYRSRSMRYGKVIAVIEIDDDGVYVDWAI